MARCIRCEEAAGTAATEPDAINEIIILRTMRGKLGVTTVTASHLARDARQS